jgi:thiamine pyrophosphate-dependent acetolactate synthase large subunit-like protein
MPLLDALQVLAQLRRDELVLTTMGASREWPRLSDHPLDFHYVPSAMGHGPMLGLGLALAQPKREVIVLNGDGCMLMSLGCLVSIVAAGAANYTLIVLENGIYEVTGGQRTAGAGVETDFAGFARAAGFPNIRQFDRLDEWRSGAAELLALPGPRFVVLRVESVGAAYHLKAPIAMDKQIARLRKALAG